MSAWVKSRQMLCNTACPLYPKADIDSCCGQGGQIGFSGRLERLKHLTWTHSANRHLDVAWSCRRLRQALRKDSQLLNYNDFSNTRSTFLSASEGNALSS